MVTLNDIVVQDGFVNQFDFMDCFYELCETSAVRKFEKDGVELYEITVDGTVAAETMQSNIIQSIRERSLRSAMRLLSFHSRGAKQSCTLEDAADGNAGSSVAIRIKTASSFRFPYSLKHVIRRS